MPSQLEILAISALLYQALPLAVAAPGRVWGWDDGNGAPSGYGNLADMDGDESQHGFSDLAKLEHSLQQGVADGGGDDELLSNHGGPAGPPFTVTISDW